MSLGALVSFNTLDGGDRRPWNRPALLGRASQAQQQLALSAPIQRLGSSGRSGSARTELLQGLCL